MYIYICIQIMCIYIHSYRIYIYIHTYIYTYIYTLNGKPCGKHDAIMTSIVASMTQTQKPYARIQIADEVFISPASPMRPPTARL